MEDSISSLQVHVPNSVLTEVAGDCDISLNTLHEAAGACDVARTNDQFCSPSSDSTGRLKRACRVLFARPVLCSSRPTCSRLSLATHLVLLVPSRGTHLTAISGSVVEKYTPLDEWPSKDHGITFLNVDLPEVFRS
jgi:hypothetical protein